MDMLRSVDKLGLKGRYVSPRLGESRSLRVLSMTNCGVRDPFVQEVMLASPWSLLLPLAL
jgi:hypothetical protein